MSKPVILCVDDEIMILESLRDQLQRFFGGDHQIEVAKSGMEALFIMDALAEEGLEIPMVISDHIMPEMNGSELMSRIFKKYPHTLTVMLTGRADSDAVGDAVNRANLYRYINKPWREEDMVLTVKEGLRRYKHEKLVKSKNEELVKLYEKATEEINKRKKAEASLKKALREIEGLQERLQKENIYLREEIKLEHNFEEIIGNSDPLKYVLYRIEKVAPVDTTVLLQGETGTGKELVARAIHQSSERNGRPLIKVNCAALPPDLMESELFGHEKGAFTGAHIRKMGRFELAHKGTLFLDEIGEIPINLQAKLLRAIEFGEFERVGNPKSIKIDVRIIAATNRNLELEAKNGNFRKDLFYRLNVYPITLPSLRQRPDDIPLLVNHFVGRFSKKMGKQIEDISQKTMDALVSYSWPGNIRELENVIERAIVLSKGKTLHIKVPQNSMITVENMKTMEDMERDYILKTLDLTQGKIAGHGGAAEILGMHPNTLRSRIDKLNIK